MGLPGALQVAKAGWIKVQPPVNHERVSAMQVETGLGAGEVSTILLAKDIGADLVLIDDLSARRFAVRIDLEIRGTVGILEVLFARKELPDLRMAFLRLLQADAFVDRALLNQRLWSLDLPLID